MRLFFLAYLGFNRNGVEASGSPLSTTENSQTQDAMSELRDELKQLEEEEPDAAWLDDILTQQLALHPQWVFDPEFVKESLVHSTWEQREFQRGPQDSRRMVDPRTVAPGLQILFNPMKYKGRRVLKIDSLSSLMDPILEWLNSKITFGGSIFNQHPMTLIGARADTRRGSVKREEMGNQLQIKLEELPGRHEDLVAWSTMLDNTLFKMKVFYPDLWIKYKYGWPHPVAIPHSEINEPQQLAGSDR